MIAALRPEIAHEILNVPCQFAPRRIPHRLCRNKPGLFVLFFPQQFRTLLFGDLLVRCAQGYIKNFATARIQPAFPVPNPLAFMFVNEIDHNQLPLMIAKTSLSRNRTPANFTRVKRPEFASRSIVRGEQASASATCFFRSNFSFADSVCDCVVI